MLRNIALISILLGFVACNYNQQNEEKFEQIIKSNITANQEKAKDQQYKIEANYNENKLKFDDAYKQSRKAQLIFKEFNEVLKKEGVTF